MVILESTCYPGCTEELVIAPLKKKGLKLSKNLFVSFSPERIDPANKKYYLNNIPKVIGSACKTSLYLTNLLYSKICKKTMFDVCPAKNLVKNKMFNCFVVCSHFVLWRFVGFNNIESLVIGFRLVFDVFSRFLVSC